MGLTTCISSCFKSRDYVTMCFFWVLARGVRDTDKLDKLDKLDKIVLTHLAPPTPIASHQFQF